MSGPVLASARGGLLIPLVVAGATASAVLQLSGHQVPLYVSLLLLLLLQAIIALGLFWSRSGVFARPVIAGPSKRPCVALTFDDGPDAEATPIILDLLEAHGARGTFFVVGERAAALPELVASLSARGHQVENHTHRHLRALAALPRRRIVAEIQESQALIERLTGRRPRFLRPPAGVLSPPIVAAARACGLTLCAWTAKARDGLAGTTAPAALRRLSRAARPGAILLLHDGVERGERRPIAPAVLAELLPLLSARGLRAVTLDELLRP